MSFLFLSSKKFWVIFSAVIVILAPGSYAGASYYQSNKLVKEAQALEISGDYAGAVAKYDQAKSKWKWNETKIAPKKEVAEKFNAQTKTLADAEANFGVGEWQKCMDYANQIKSDFPKYSQAQNRYSDCKKKLDDQIAADAAAKAAADKLAADAAAKAAAAKTTAKKTTTSTATATVASNLEDRIYATVKNYCGGTTFSSLCSSCVNNDATCKAKVDSTVASMRDICRVREYASYPNTAQSYIDIRDAQCAKCLADANECMLQYNEGR